MDYLEWIGRRRRNNPSTLLMFRSKRDALDSLLAMVRPRPLRSFYLDEFDAIVNAIVLDLLHGYARHDAHQPQK
jgi:hypothetical protein